MDNHSIPLQQLIRSEQLGPDLQIIMARPCILARIQFYYYANYSKELELPVIPPKGTTIHFKSATLEVVDISMELNEIDKWIVTINTDIVNSLYVDVLLKEGFTKQ